MIDLPDSSDPDDDIDGLEGSGPATGETKSPATQRLVTTSEVLPRLVLEAALGPRQRRLLEQGARVVIIAVPAAAWAEPIAEALGQIDATLKTCIATERTRSGGQLRREGKAYLSLLKERTSVIYICQDPEEILDEAVLAAADATIKIPALRPALLRRTIREVTGVAAAHGITTEMAALDLPIIFSDIRPGLAARECVTKLREAVARQTKPAAADVPVLAELPLTASMRKWSDQLLGDLAAVKQGALNHGKLVFVLLEGPPGTGKTLIAESLAHTAGWAFVPTTVGSWFTSGDGALGGVAKNVKTFIDDLLARAPAIGFIDEVDAIPNRATMDNRGRDWWTPVVNLVLTEIDRLRRSGKPVLLIGATNFYQHLDAALIRPGRLQQRVPVLPPQTEDDVVAVLHYYLGDELTDAELAKLARPGLGATPATIEGWVKEARAAARAAARNLHASDVLEQMLPRDERSSEDMRAVAVHEIGHAVVAHRLGLGVDRISIIAEAGSGGQTHTRLPSLFPTWDHLCDLVTVTLGGRAADMILGNGANTGAEGDLAQATSMLRSALERQGLGKGLAHLPELGTRRPGVAAAVEARLGQLLTRAVAIIDTDRALALAQADRLIAERILSGEDMARVLSTPASQAQPQTPPASFTAANQSDNSSDQPDIAAPTQAGEHRSIEP